MLYIIHSPKQTSYNNGTKMYWKPNGHGYTHLLAEAGFYTEEDKNQLELKIQECDATFLPVTRKLLEEAQLQIEEWQEHLREKESCEINRHISIQDEQWKTEFSKHIKEINSIHEKRYQAVILKRQLMEHFAELPIEDLEEENEEREK